MIKPLRKGKVLQYPHISTKRGQCSSFFRPSPLATRGTNRQKLPVGVISTTTRLGRYNCSLRDKFRSLSTPSSWRAVRGSKEAKCSSEAGSRSNREGWVLSNKPGFDPRNSTGGFEVAMVVRVRRVTKGTSDALIVVAVDEEDGPVHRLRSRGRSPAERFHVH